MFDDVVLYIRLELMTWRVRGCPILEWFGIDTGENEAIFTENLWIISGLLGKWVW